MGSRGGLGEETQNTAAAFASSNQFMLRTVRQSVFTGQTKRGQKFNVVFQRHGGRARSFSARAVGQDDSDGSRYENYHEVSKVYDNMRFPGGFEVILGALTGRGRTPVHNQTVLDMGCGTGNYSAALVGHVKKLVCFDGNSSMLGNCEAKVNALKKEKNITTEVNRNACTTGCCKPL